MAISRSNILWTLLVTCTCCHASPLAKRQKAPAKPTDFEILNYALMLERMQVALYSEGLATFTKQDFTASNFSSSVYSDFSTILSDEKSHVSYYESALQSKSDRILREHKA